VHRVLLDGDLNAGIVQVPRLGVLGWHRNHLLVGLPMLQALTPDQFRAVLAHELGHLSGNHGRFSGWIYRVRQTWGRLLERLEQEDHWGTAIFRRFLRWYAPYFNAYSFALARGDEYEADRASADVAGARPAGEALLRAEVAGWVLHSRYWPELLGRAEHEPAPPRTAYAPLARELAAVPAGEDQAEVARATRWGSAPPSSSTSTCAARRRTGRRRPRSSVPRRSSSPGGSTRPGTRTSRPAGGRITRRRARRRRRCARSRRAPSAARS
jgi:hypothetical protein